MKERKGQGVEGFQPHAGPVRHESHHQIKLLIISFSAYLFGELIDRPKKNKKKKPFMYSLGGLQTHRPKSFFFLFWRPQASGTFLSFFQEKFFFSENLTLLCTPHKPVSLSLYTVLLFPRPFWKLVRTQEKA